MIAWIFWLASRFLSNLWIVFKVTIALSLIHIRCNLVQHALGLFTSMCIHWLLPGNGFNAVDSSASIFKSLLTGDCLTTNLALIRNNLQQWGLFRFPRLRKGLLSNNNFRLGLVCLPCRLSLHFFLVSADWFLFRFSRYKFFTDPTESTFSFSSDIAQPRNYRDGSHRKRRFRQFFYRCVPNCCQADVAFTLP
jgi:hypothetical protein